MDDRDDSGLKELEARLKQARSSTGRRTGDGPGNSREPVKGVGFAARVGTDILAALVVGLGLGWFIDRWLGTAPFGMLVFFVFGAAAGIRNAYVFAQRTMNEIDEGDTKSNGSAVPPEGDGSGRQDDAGDRR